MEGYGPLLKIIILRGLREFSTIVGGVYTLMTIVDYFWTQNRLTAFIKDRAIFFLVVLVVSCLLYCAVRQREYTCKLNGYDTRISICIGDIVRQKHSLVISTNSSFATSIEEGIISKTSVQGAFQEEFYAANENQLIEEICASLSYEAPRDCKDAIIKDKAYPVYPVGTVAKIEQGDRHVYFVALNDINEHGQNIDHNIEDVYHALNGLWDGIKRKGHKEEKLAIPLIGSGHADIADATKNEIVKTIIDYYVSFVQNDRACITNNLEIYINPKDLDAIDYSAAVDYLTYRCHFTEKPSNKTIGTII